MNRIGIIINESLKIMKIITSLTYFVFLKKQGQIRAKRVQTFFLYTLTFSLIPIRENDNELEHFFYIFT